MDALLRFDIHAVTGLDAVGRIEAIGRRQGAVDAGFSRRVWIVLDQVEQQLVRHLSGKDRSEGTIQVAQSPFIAMGQFCRDGQAAAVGNSFIADELAVFMESLPQGIGVVIRAESSG